MQYTALSGGGQGLFQDFLSTSNAVLTERGGEAGGAQGDEQFAMLPVASTDRADGAAIGGAPLC